MYNDRKQNLKVNHLLKKDILSLKVLFRRITGLQFPL